jgi:hypothetical protein
MSTPQTLYRYEVPIDGLWHAVEGCSTPLFVAARRSDPVEFWAYPRPDLPARWFRVYGTGRPVPEGAEYRGSVVTNGGLYVWHLFEDRNPDDGERAPA